MIKRILSLLFIGTILISACTAQPSAIPPTHADPSAPPPTATDTIQPPTATPAEIVPTHTNAPTLTDTPVPQPVDRLLASFGRHWATRLISSRDPQGVFISFGNRLCFYPQPDLKEEWCTWVDRSARGYAWVLAMNPQKPVLALGLANGEVKFVDAKTGSLIGELKAAPDNLRSLAWSPDGTLLASGTDDLWIKIWDADTGEVVKQVQADQSSVLVLAWSPDGKRLAGGTFFGNVYLWDIEKEDTMAVWNASDGGTITALAWTADSRSLYATAAYEPGCGEGCDPLLDGLAVRLDGETLTPLAQWDSNNPILSLALSPDESLIAFGLRNGAVKLLKADMGRTTAETIGSWTQGGLAWADDEEVLFLRQGDLDSSKPGGSNFPASSAPDRLIRWQPSTGAISEYLFPGGGSVSMPAWSPDGARLAMGTPTGEILIWNIQEGVLVRSLKVSDGFSPAAWSPDSSLLAGQDLTGNILLFDTRTWKLEKQIGGEVAPPRRLLWSPAGKWIAEASWDSVYIWDVQSGERVFQLTSDSSLAVAWSMDGMRLATAGGEDGSQISIWEVATGELIKEIRVSGWATNLSWSAGTNGERLAISHGGWGEVWDIESGKMLLQISAPAAGHGWSIEHAALSPDGKVFATAAAEILLWDTASGKLLARLEGHTDSVNDLSFSPDGKRLASASYEGVILVWDVE